VKSNPEIKTATLGINQGAAVVELNDNGNSTEDLHRMRRKIPPV
jgi:hypothetical protein